MAIVVSHIAADFDLLARQALRQAPLADVVELRLDRIGHPGKARLAELVRACPKPVVVTVHGAEAFGDFAGSVDERLGLLADAAEAGARFVDVDYRLSLDLGEVPAPCHRIVSRHETEGTPETLAELDAQLEEVRAELYEGDLVKLVTHARTCEDGMRFLRWLRTTKAVVGFTSGAAGSFTRVLAPIFGSPFTYCAPAAVPGAPAPPATAPGQLRVNDLRAIAPPGGLTQETAVFGVVGNPIGHSFSPWVQGMALKAARLDAVYVAFEPEDLAAFLALAEDENFRGFSVTAPFKEDAFRLAARSEEGARRTAAVNTLVRERDGWRGANTDVTAVRATIEKALVLHARRTDRPGGPLAPAEARTLVLGAGGAARAAVWALRALGAPVTVAGRTPERARRVAEELGCDAIAWEEIPRHEHDVLIHATPVGGPGHEGELIVPAAWLRPDSVVLDAVYRPIRTPLLAAAIERGATPVAGGEWFVRQALEQFHLFTGVEADEALVAKAFEHAHAAVGER